MTSKDLVGIKFEKGTGNYKYTAILTDGKRVNFGNKNYEHFKDSVPKNKGGKLWSHLDHKDETRRQSYRKRHGGIVSGKGSKRAINVKYSPAWFSYHFLW